MIAAKTLSRISPAHAEPAERRSYVRRKRETCSGLVTSSWLLHTVAHWTTKAEVQNNKKYNHNNGDDAEHRPSAGS
jgi:hypothetical protein